MVFLLWYLLHMTIKSNVIPSPFTTVTVFIKLFPKTLFKHLLVSLSRILIAIGLSLLIGVPVGLYLGVNKGGDKIISPIIYILYPIPKIAFLPIFMIIFGIGDGAKIFLILTIIIFQIIIASRDGVNEIPKELFYSVYSLGVKGLGVYKHLILPSVLPKIISGLRISVGISISALFFAENFATSYGIGYYIMNSWSMVNYQEMFSGILGLSMLGLLMFKFLDLLDRKINPWIYDK